MKARILFLPLSLLLVPYLLADEGFTLPEQVTIAKKTTVKLANASAQKAKQEVQEAQEKIKISTEQARENSRHLKEEIKEGAHHTAENIKIGARHLKEKVKEGATRAVKKVQRGAHSVKDAVTGAVGESMIETAQERAQREEAVIRELQEREVLLRNRIAHLEAQLADAYRPLKTTVVVSKPARIKAEVRIRELQDREAFLQNRIAHLEAQLEDALNPVKTVHVAGKHARAVVIQR